MSGITGIFRRDGKDADPADIKKMNDKIAHRGPDDSRVWCEGPVALGHQMLHTTQESLHEILPFEDAESGLVITADARIDNRKDLAPQLGIEDNEYVSDSYFILKAYEKWGEKCPEELLGDFAFAIWDKNKERLFCARDHMGVKSFYYYLSDEVLFFASEIKALLFFPEVPLKLNKLKMAESLCLLFSDKKITFYENILRLSPANTITLSNNHVDICTYWELDLNNEIRLNSDEEYANAFLEIFKDAVNCRLRSAFSMGSLLSGGLDSSSIVCTARELLSENKNQHLKTYSATFNDTPECDEQHYINKVLEKGELSPYFIEADKLSPLSQIDDILWHLDEPHFAVNFYFHWHIHQLAMKNGDRVILEGFDGDTTLSHGERFEIDFFKSLKWFKCIKELYLHTRLTKRNIFKQHILQSLILPFFPEFAGDLLKLVPFFPLRTIGTFNLINENLAKETNIKENVKNQENQYRLARSSKSFHLLKLNSGVQYVLELIDKSAAAASLEARYPFFDRRLVEFCLALPIEQKINNGWSRIILRRAMENILPEEVQWRKDKGKLGSNFRKNFLLFEKQLIEDIIFNQSYLIKDYVNIASIRKIYGKYVSNKGTSVLSLFGVITIALWIKKTFRQNLNHF
nr:lasso peptide isopeptide bond-forming cyclase [uncultured Methanobacterium sp.]